MLTAPTFVVYFLLNYAHGFDFESFENMGIEQSPFYEMIIYNDLADVFNEFENNKILFEKATEESESGEDIADLLSEYHTHLEKADKERVNYLERSKHKSNVPIIRHKKFTKVKPLDIGNRMEYYKNSYYNSGIYPQSLKPFNMLIPFNSNNHLTTSERAVNNEGLKLVNKFSLASSIPFSNMPVESSCNCKDGRNSCTECIIPLNNSQRKAYHNIKLPNEEKTVYSNNPLKIGLPDTLNIRIKVDVQVPKVENYNDLFNNQNPSKTNDYDNHGVSKEYLSSIKLPSTYFNFPIPMNLFGYKGLFQSDKHDTLSSSPLHKTTVHKKKKTKLSNGLKKHRKNVIAFNNLKINPMLQPQLEIFNTSKNNTHKIENNKTTSTVTVGSESFVTHKPNSMSTTTTVNANITQNRTDNRDIIFANITSNIENLTINDKNKTGNSIEAEYKNNILNPSTKAIHLLRKRELKQQNKSTIIIKETAAMENTSVSKKANATKNTIKKGEVSIPPDSELLYWPNNSLNNTKDNSKNITAIILESENKKDKLNISAETIRLNHTRVLEQAIFGNVDWNDVDSVVPAFISFFGKYIEGVISFCSENICHSMKCTKNICIHRVCTPQDRFNNKGHCTGSNNTDSAASMDSTMDLPSNIAFEIVDILKDRMIGKLFGKITLCINSKCITLASSKKLFLKNKCSEKQLSPKGHCEVKRS